MAIEKQDEGRVAFGERVAESTGRVVGRFVRGLRDTASPKEQQIASAYFGTSVGRYGASQVEDLASNTKAYGCVGHIHSCVKAIATQGASVPLMLYRKKGPDKRTWEKLPGHPILERFQDPNPDASETDFDLLEALFADWSLSGNWYLYVIRRPDGFPERIHRLPPENVRVVPSRERRVDGYILNVNGETISFDRDEVGQSKTFNPLPGGDLYGLSDVQAAKLPAILDIHGLLWNINFYQEGAIPGGLIEVDGKMDEEVRKRLKEDWEKGHKGPDRQHRVAILEGGAKWHEQAIAHRDLEYIEGRRMTREEILEVFHVYPAVIGILEYANYANMEAQLSAFWHLTMIPKLAKMQRALTRILCHPYDESLTLEFDLSRVWVLIKNQLEMAQVDAQLVQSGICLINERREERGLDPLPHGDVAWMQMQMIPVTSATHPELKQIGDGRPARHMKRFYTEPRLQKAREAVWETSVVGPNRKQFKTKVLAILAKQRAEVVGKIEATTRSLDDALAEAKAKNGGKASVDAVKQAIDSLVESWLFDYEYWYDGTLRAIHPTLLNAANTAGRFGLLEVGLDVGFDLANPRIQRAIQEKEFVFAQEWNASTLRRLRATLHEGVGAGENAKELIGRVDVAFAHEKDNSDVVAQTEVGAVSNAGALEGYRQSGVVESKEWRAAGPNPRPHHIEASNQVVPLDDLFAVGGEMLAYPGDPAGRPDNVCNCHCIVLPVVAEEV
jgi:HK97 family phage portal protein